MQIGEKVRIKENLTPNSVAYFQRGRVGIITQVDTSRTFPYFVDFGSKSNERLDWFWKEHLEKFI